MFLTNQNMRMWVPMPVSGEGEAYWRFVGLPLRTPWYVVTLDQRVKSEVEELSADTVLVHLDRDLRDLLESDAFLIEQVLCISSKDDSPGWSVVVVAEVWEVDVPGGPEDGNLLFVHQGQSESQLFNSRHEKVALKQGAQRLYPLPAGKCNSANGSCFEASD